MDYAKKVMAIIVEQLGVSESEVKEDTAFEDIGADSLDLFQIISALEEEFEIEFDNEDTDKIKTVGDAITYVKAILEQD